MKNKKMLFVCLASLFLMFGVQAHAALPPQCGTSAKYYVPAPPAIAESIKNIDFSGVFVDNVAPTTNLCSVGAVADPVRKGKYNPLVWEWSCYNDGYNPVLWDRNITFCSAPVYNNAKCGSAADGSPSAVRPTTNLCSIGTLQPNAYDGGWLITKDSLSPVGVYKTNSTTGTNYWKWMCQNGSSITTAIDCKLQYLEPNGCENFTCTPETALTPSAGKCWNNVEWVSGKVNCIDNGCAADTCIGDDPCWNGVTYVDGTKDCAVDNGCAGNTCKTSDNGSPTTCNNGVNPFAPGTKTASFSDFCIHQETTCQPSDCGKNIAGKPDICIRIDSVGCMNQTTCVSSCPAPDSVQCPACTNSGAWREVNP